MKFAKEYIETVLAQNFEDAKRLFFQPLMDVHYAHLIMLEEVGILTRPEARELVLALDRITFSRIEPVAYDGSFEDLFFYIERLLEEDCDANVAGKLHTARSRNDIDTTIYRLRWREEIPKVQQAAIELRETLIDVCRREKANIYPMYTHTQAAQPSTFAHYFLGVIEHLERDHTRLTAAFNGMNRSPLGSCAITGTGFCIDRHLTSDLLGFDGPTGNTHASIAGVDYLLEAVAALQILMTTQGKVLHDLLLWSTTAFSFLRLGDGYVQCSSIMPQKRNPVSLEHSRAICSRGFGKASAVFQMLHNTPFGDIVDCEDDLQPLVEGVFEDCLGPLRILSGALKTATFNSQGACSKEDQSWITMTELADTLVRTEGISFRAAHSIAGQMVKDLSAQRVTCHSEALKQASLNTLGRPIELPPERLREILDPSHFVAVRRTLGGPSIEVVEAAIEDSQRKLDQDREELAAIQHRLRTFRELLQKRASDL
ncbi:MAG: argininosuccinate lyase [Acidobacteriota bacterium]|nr:MAG: argininosuccinate lyase [Acidobacteriota bacterium]